MYNWQVAALPRVPRTGIAATTQTDMPTVSLLRFITLDRINTYRQIVPLVPTNHTVMQMTVSQKISTDWRGYRKD